MPIATDTTTKIREIRSVSTNKLEAFHVILDTEDVPTLRQTSKPVTIEEIKTPEFQLFLDRMLYTLRTHVTAEGWIAAGLAAIQVGNPIRVFLAKNSNTKEDQIFINPQLEYLGAAQDTELESCLSQPTQKGDVRRFKRVRVTYFDREGNQHRDKFSGWTARIIQHEYDHLDGILFTDKRL